MLSNAMITPCISITVKLLLIELNYSSSLIVARIMAMPKKVTTAETRVSADHAKPEILDTLILFEDERKPSRKMKRIVYIRITDQFII